MAVPLMAVQAIVAGQHKISPGPKDGGQKKKGNPGGIVCSESSPRTDRGRKSLSAELKSRLKFRRKEGAAIVGQQKKWQ